MGSYSFYGEILPGEGEDAKPICAENPNSEVVFVAAVLDGVGGSGCQKYSLNGRERTGAAFASKRVGRRLDNLFKSTLNWSQDLSEVVNFLHNEISKVLLDIDEKSDNTSNSEGRLRTKLIKKFPTTLALAYLTKNNSLRFFWAGNSRIYHFSRKNKKLNFISIDDAKGIENSISNEDTVDYMLSHKDYPMSNCINLSTEFFINYSECSDFSFGDLIIVATDGVYGCFKSHNELEGFLIRNCTEPEFNLRPLGNYVEENHDDDYSLSAFTINLFQEKIMDIEKHTEPNKSSQNGITGILLSITLLLLTLVVTILDLKKQVTQLKRQEALQANELKEISTYLKKLVLFEERKATSPSSEIQKPKAAFPTTENTPAIPAVRSSRPETQ